MATGNLTQGEREDLLMEALEAQELLGQAAQMLEHVARATDNEYFRRTVVLDLSGEAFGDSTASRVQDLVEKLEG